jgi:Bacterial PH domain
VSAAVDDPTVPQASPVSWLPRRSAGGEVALWLGVGLVALGVIAVLLLAAPAALAIGPTMLALALVACVLLVGGGALLLWAVSYRQLVYWLGPTTLEVPWLGERVVIPFAAIEGIYTGQRLAGQTAPRGLRWPGIYVGAARLPSLGYLQFYATSSDPAALTLVAVEGGALVVSARDPQGFRASLIERVRTADPLLAPEDGSRLVAAASAPWTTVRDHWFPWCIGVAVVLLLVTLAVVTLRYAELPELIPIRFDSGGRVTATGPPADLLRLPLGGLIVLVANLALGVWAHPRDRVVARMLWVGAALVQAILLIAVARLVQ